jgi:hypothetical protein
MNYEVNKWNWELRKDHRATIAGLEKQIEDLQRHQNELFDLCNKLDRITQWKDGYPYRIEIKRDGGFQIQNMEWNYWAQVYRNAQDDTKWGLNTRQFANHLSPYTHNERHVGHDFTLEEATKLAHKYVGYGTLPPRQEPVFKGNYYDLP